jgi:aldose 1-epimerase
MRPPTFRPCLALVACTIVLPCAATKAAPGAPQVSLFGASADGVRVEQVSVENRLGMRVRYTDYGATLTSIEVPDRHGKRANIILGMPDLPAYLGSKRRFGTVGRFAGKIAGMRYTLDGAAVDLEAGGQASAPGYERRIWQRRDFQDAQSSGSVFTLVSPAGDQGFPGTLTVDVTYRLLRDRNELRIEYAASTDAPTVLNLTNHSYFNLAGAGSEGLRTHRFQIDADRYVATQAKLPTGELPSVAGTPLDFRAGGELYGRMAARPALLGDPPGYDHQLVFAKPAGAFAKVARIEDSVSGRRMEVWTSEPSAQLFTGASFDGVEVGAQGHPYRPNDGFAFEPQHLSDSPNQPGFPTTALYPGRQFKAVTSLRFSVAGARSKARTRR